jgi:hypothetical protein
MICIAITVEAFEATLPLGSVGYETKRGSGVQN